MRILVLTSRLVALLQTTPQRRIRGRYISTTANITVNATGEINRNFTKSLLFYESLNGDEMALMKLIYTEHYPSNLSNGSNDTVTISNSIWIDNSTQQSMLPPPFHPRTPGAGDDGFPYSISSPLYESQPGGFLRRPVHGSSFHGRP